MERQDPYIGDGTPTPQPVREPRHETSPLVPVSIAVVVLVIGVAAAWFFWWRDVTSPAPAPQQATVPAAPPLPVAQPPRNPIDSTAADQPLPALKDSDGPVAAALSALVGLDAFGRTFITENLVRNIVATVDNLPREEVSQRVNPVRAAPGVPVVTGTGQGLVLSHANAKRYEPYIRLMEALDTQQAVNFYRRNYPLFQQAYVELGYPNGYFNDRVVEVIDHLLATPDPKGPLRLKQPKVLYEFADPELEELSAGQKVMLRIGSENRERVKAKLREVRAAIAKP